MSEDNSHLLLDKDPDSDSVTVTIGETTHVLLLWRARMLRNMLTAMLDGAVEAVHEPKEDL